MMKKILLILIFAAISTSGFAQFSGPESIAYDSLQKRYLISNTTSGNIVQRAQDGTITTFVTGATSARGIVIYNNKLYVACGTIIRGYDLSNGSQIMTVTVTGSSFLNDLTVDSDGILYISDFNGNKIYKLNTATQAYWIYVAATVNQPNGVYWDGARNRLLFCCWGSNAPIKSIKLSDSSMSTLRTTFYSNCDGITMDKNNNVYISTWGSQSVAKYNVDLTTGPTIVTSGLSNPADIFVNKASDTLVVPNAGNSTVTYYFLNNPTDITTHDISVKGFELSQNYPNPFNPSTKINFTLGSQEIVNLKVYDASGKLIQTLINNEAYNPGSYSENFNAEKLSNGIYFYKLETESFTETKKMMLIK